MLALGNNIIDLSVGEFYKRPNNQIIEYAVHANNVKEFGYTDPTGIHKLKNQISRKIEDSYKFDKVDTSEISITSGAKHAIAVTLNSIIETQGDSVICFSPFWPSYVDIIKISGALPVCLDSDYLLDVNFEQFTKTISSNTKAIIFNSPRNPDGYVYTSNFFANLNNLHKMFPNIYLIFDDVYRLISWDPFYEPWDMCELPQVDKRKIIIINSFSKSCSMTGLRVGYVYANSYISSLIKIQLSNSISNVPTLSQHAATYAQENEFKLVKNLNNDLSKASKILFNILTNMNEIKTNFVTSGFFYFVCFDYYISKLGLKDDVELSRHLLQEYNLISVPGTLCGAPGYLRLSIGADPKDISSSKNVFEKLSLSITK